MTGLTQPWHIILILLVALMLFGGRRLPEIGRSLGDRHAGVQELDHGSHLGAVAATRSARDDRIRLAADRARDRLASR